MGGLYGEQLAEQRMVAGLVGAAVPVVGEALPPAGTLVRVVGTAAPGPAGILRAPLSGAPCVWYQSWRLSANNVRTTPYSYGPQPLPPFASSTTPFVGASLLSAPRQELSTTTFLVDGPCGPFELNPVGAHVDVLVQALNEADPRGGTLVTTGGEIRVEWIIAPGTPVLAIGTTTAAPDGAPALAAPTGAQLVVTDRNERELLAKAQAFEARRPLLGGGGATNVWFAVLPLAAVLVVAVVVLVVLVS